MKLGAVQVLEALAHDCFRLVAAAELWQACDRYRQEQTLTRYQVKRPL